MKLPTITRDGVLLWLLAGSSLVAYLLADGRPPNAWAYNDWLKFLTAVFAWLVGKAQNSWFPSSQEVQSAKETV